MLRSLLFLILMTSLLGLLVQQNNVCRSFYDYYHPNDNKNCYYDPDLELETPELIRKYTGVVEIHPLVTDDGYIITMFRIPAKNPKGVILMHHSLAIDSRIYLWQTKDSLAITLWRNGFDVWLANHRGTSHSDKHINISSHSYQYWDFSAHEIAVYDVSAELRTIRAKTNNSSVIYLGHSLGSNVGAVYASAKSEEAAKYLKAMVLLALPCYFDHATSILTAFAPFVTTLESFTRLLQMGSPLVLLPLLRGVVRILLRFFPFFLTFSSWIVWLMCGYTPEETDPTFFNFDILKYVNNFSWKTFFHYLHLRNQHQFQYYNYGQARNLKVYGNETSPLYPINEISVPLLIVSSSDDSLTTLKDAETFIEKLSPKAKDFGHWKVKGLNHLDFHIGLHRNDIFRDRLVSFLNNLSKNTMS